MDSDAKHKMGTIVVGLIFIGSTLAIAFNYAFISPQRENQAQSITYKADLSVKVYGESYSFDSSELYSSNLIFLDERGDIYKRAKNLTIGDLFSSMGVTFNGECFSEYCSNENITMKFFVNGKENDQYDNYNVQNGDSISIVYGSKEQRPKDFSTGTIKITSNGFIPKNLNISQGTSVTWENVDDFPHGVIGENFESDIIAPGFSFKYTFFENGTYNYTDTESDFSGRVIVS